MHYRETFAYRRNGCFILTEYVGDGTSTK